MSTQRRRFAPDEKVAILRRHLPGKAAGPHEHWHIDVTYVNICGTFFYLASVLEGFSRCRVRQRNMVF